MMFARNNNLPSIREEMTSRNYSCGEDEAGTTKTMITTGRQTLITYDVLDSILDWIIFPMMLFIQFAATMYCQQQHGILLVKWSTTMSFIAVFCLASVAYRKVFRVHPIQSMALLLVPELFTNVVLASVMLLKDLSMAVDVLIVLTSVIILSALIGKLQIDRHDMFVPPPNANDYKRLNCDEDDDSDDGYMC